MAWRPQLTSPQWVDAVRFYVDLLRNYGPPGSVTDGYNEVRALFSTGNCAMSVGSPAAAGYLLDASQSRVAKTTGFAKAPIAKVTDGSAWLWSWALAVPATSKKAVMAKQFIRWATSREYVSLVGERAGWLAAPPGTRQSTYNNAAYQRAAPFAPLTRDAILAATFAKPSALPVPYAGIQYVGIPEFRQLARKWGRRSARR